MIYCELEVKYKNYWEKTKFYQGDIYSEVLDKIRKITDPVREKQISDVKELQNILGRPTTLTENASIFTNNFDVSFKVFEKIDLGDCHGLPLFLNKILIEIKGHMYPSAVKINRYILGNVDDDFINSFFGENTEVIRHVC